MIEADWFTRMYCQSCHYDLCGQIEPRCPECGRGFDPDDSRTYDGQPQRGVMRLVPRVRPWLSPLPILLTAGLIAFYLARPSPYGCYGISYQIVSEDNLDVVTRYWLIERYKTPQGCDLDLDAARRHVPRRLSAWNDQPRIESRIAWQLWARRANPSLIAAFIYVVLMLVLVLRRKPRLRVVACVVGLLLAAGITACTCSEQTASLLWPGNRAYVDDFVYLTNVPWSNSAALEADTVIAYEKRSWSGRRSVAFVSGLVDKIPDEKLSRLLHAQGRAAPVP